MMSSIYIGTTGMKALGEGLSTVSNNLANASTVGFKYAMMLYEDLMSAQVASASSNYSNGTISGVSQKGMGVSVATNRTMFLQGAFETGSEPTDMAISGLGFFGVVKNGVTEYTRAGNFRFTKEGDLVDPSGFSLLGYKITAGIVEAAATPVKLELSLDAARSGEAFMEHKATSAVSLIENLGDTTRRGSGTIPIESLVASWNGLASPPLAASAVGHVDTVPIYDNSGELQNLNVYFDYVGNIGGRRIYEYAIGTDPEAAGDNEGSAAAGLFAAGTMTFSPSGELMDMTMFTAPEDGDITDMSKWAAASFGPDGQPALTASFANAEPGQIRIDFGLQMDGVWSNSYASAADLIADPSGLSSTPPRTRNSLSSSAYAGASAGITQKQDGYGDGYLTSIAINADGYMSGQYSNGQSQDLYRIPLYSFTSQDNLRREGGNHYSAPVTAGQIVEGFPREEHFGALAQNSLEQSNVDMAREFATMIVTQRGFQMNSKVVTTSDQMLQRALELKR